LASSQVMSMLPIVWWTFYSDPDFPCGLATGSGRRKTAHENRVVDDLWASYYNVIHSEASEMCYQEQVRMRSLKRIRPIDTVQAV
jgi:hypothetical protein